MRVRGERRNGLFLAALCVLAAMVPTIPAMTTDPNEVISLRNSRGVQADIIPIGATIQRLLVPDINGKAEDIVLGYDDPQSYRNNPPYFGGIVGRVANRIQNASFTLEGKTYKLDANDRGNTLHGGFDPLFENNTWSIDEASPTHVVLKFFSPDGAQGFPGNLNVTATYTLNDNNELRLAMEATTDKATPINLAQHSYFNLNGQARDTILNHLLQINGNYVTPTDVNQIPNGELAAVKGSPFDFTTPHPIGERIKLVTFPPPYGGYDHNYALFGLGFDAVNKTWNGMVSEEPKLAATLMSPLSGRAMDLSTNAPGLQVYSGNNLNGSIAGKGAYLYQQYGGIALESQDWPDALHKNGFPAITLYPGQEYRHIWMLKFYTYNSTTGVNTRV